MQAFLPNHRIVSAWTCIFSLFLAKTFAVSSIGSPIGFFELQIVKVQNTAGELYSGNCCDGTRSDYGCHANECDTFFRLCLKEYQLSGNEPESDSCTFGNSFSPVLGQNSFTVENIKDPTNPGRLKIPLLFTWTRTFTLILEAFDQDGLTGKPRVIDSENQLIDHHVHSGLLTPDSVWHPGSHSGRTAHIEYLIRVRCNINYYGYNCTKFCKPRDDYHGHYTCDRNGNKQCLSGWMGNACNKPQCRLGCHSEHGSCNRPNECVCEYGWTGDLCTECARYPGCVHGTCSQPWQCQCDTNWGGLLCDKNLNYCGTHHPCENGGTCTNPEPDKFQCSCLDGFSGLHCEIVKFSCVSNPCQNGGICQNQGAQYRCACKPGWTGSVCETNIDDCASSPCSNGGVCRDLVDGFLCDCPPHWEGDTCALDADECKNSPCVHAQRCLNFPGNYYCDCYPGWEGVNCDLNVDECASNKCKNGGSCLDLVNGFHCTCPPGFTGKRCELNVNECDDDPCLKGGQCVDKFGSFVCICPPGFSGQRCELNEGHCRPDPCQNGAQCFNYNNDYYCNCSSKYEGKNCSVLRDVCETSLCEVIDSCTIHVASNRTESGFVLESSEICGPNGRCISLPENQYECECASGYEGKHCELDVDNCTGVSCLNGGTCIDGRNSYTCLCVDGWEGMHCENNIDDCRSDPCHGRGTCLDLVNDFICQCNSPWKGKTCRSHTQCDDNTCSNGGVCIESETTFNCQCPPEWSGKSCDTRTVPVCASDPCLNGGVCVGSGSTYECNCKDGFAGIHCEDNIDDCAPQPCFNNGTCVDGVNHYTCRCLDGFAGPDCRINVNECLSSPCSYDSVCVDLINDYKCTCPSGRAGKNCDQVESQKDTCLMNGNFYPDKSTWRNVCNSCRCKKGVTHCSKMWCGEEKCNAQLPCPPAHLCRNLPSSDCFSGNCKSRAFCYPEEDSLPAATCRPTSTLLPSNCRRVTMFFNMTLMQPGVWAQDICISIRLLPAVMRHALYVPLVIRCAVNDVNRNAIDVTIGAKTSGENDVVESVADILSKLSNGNTASNVYVSALLRVRINVLNPNSTEDAINLTTLIAALGAVVFALLALVLVVCFCVTQRQRKRPKSPCVDVRDNNMDSLEKFVPEVTNNRKLTNHDLQEQHSNILDVKRLSMQKNVESRDLSCLSSAKLRVSMEEKKLINLVPEDETSIQECDDEIYTSSPFLNKNSSIIHQREDLIDVINHKKSLRNPVCCSSHIVTPLPESRYVSRRHSVRHAHVSPRCDELNDVIEVSYPSQQENSRLLSGDRNEACCEHRSHHCARSDPGEFPESERGHVVSSAQTSSHRQCPNCQCLCHRSSSQRNSDPHQFRRSRHARLSSSHVDDPCFSEVNPMRRLRSDSYPHSPTSAEPDLPPYDSIVPSDLPPRSYCDRSYHSSSPTSSSGHYFQSPPPSYTHHCKHSRSWKTSDVCPRSENSSTASPYSPGRSSPCCGSSTHCDSDCVNSRAHVEQRHLSQNVNDVRTSLGDNTTSDLLSCNTVSQNAVV